MNDNNHDIIAAIATPPGRGGISIIRISGSGSLDVLRKVFSHKGMYRDHTLYYGRVGYNGEDIDEAMCVFMRAPKTYTGEDVCEIQLHASPITVKRALSAIIDSGARAAEAGEFTKRAFLNGRIDLSQAEAVMQLISANSEVAARCSLRQLGGGAAAAIKPIMDSITACCALIDAEVDFPDEIDEDDNLDKAISLIDSAISALAPMCDERAASIIREGASVVLAGSPNVGKSSLMNAISGSERAIVTDIPGTTRDVLTMTLSLNGVSVELTDTAGIRASNDPVEKIGVDRAKRAVDEADIVIAVIDKSGKLSGEDDTLLRNIDDRYIVCVNKSDIAKDDTDNTMLERIVNAYGINKNRAIEVSAITGEGIKALMNMIAEMVSPPDTALINARHVELAKSAKSALNGARQAAINGTPLDVVETEIRFALETLAEITGENATEAVIDRVFKDFCVGK